MSYELHLTWRFWGWALLTTILGACALKGVDIGADYLVSHLFDATPGVVRRVQLP